MGKGKNSKNQCIKQNSKQKMQERNRRSAKSGKASLSSVGLTMQFVAALGIATIIIYFAAYIFDGKKSASYNIYMAAIVVAMVAFLCISLCCKDFVQGSGTAPGSEHGVKGCGAGQAMRWERIFLLSVGGLGIAMMLAMPPLSGDDEWMHFLGAYHCSNMMMGVEDIEDQGMFMRLEDATYVKYRTDFQDLYDNISEHSWVKPVTENKMFYIEYAYMTSWYRFIAPAIGITLGRLLNLGVIGVMFLGRLFNFTQFLLLGYLAIRLLPSGKPALVAVSLLPQVLSLCTSFSYDCISISVTIVYGAIILRCAQAEYEIRIADIILVVACLLAFIPNKGVYLIFGLLIFMIPFKNFKDFLREKSNCIFAAIALVAVGIGLKLMYPLFVRHVLDGFINGMRGAEPAFTEQYPGVVSFSVGYLLQNPGHGLWLLKNSIINEGWSGFLSMLGQNPGYTPIQISLSVGLIVMLAMLVISLIFIKDGIRLSLWQYVIFAITSVLTVLGIFLGSLLRFTPLSDSHIQAQPRYFLPVFIIGMLVCGKSGTKRIINEKAEIHQLIILLIYLVSCLCICQIIRLMG